MLQSTKTAVLALCKHLGLFQMVAQSNWRGQRLVILCYHGLALKDEHRWNPSLFITPELFRRRMEVLANGAYAVLGLGEAVRRLQTGRLPKASVAITFDDGFHDFHQEALPVLRRLSLPATVYQTTYYCDYQYPIFNLSLRYLLWRGRGKMLDGHGLGVPQVFDLTSEAQQNKALAAFIDHANQRDLPPGVRDELAASIAASLGVDYSEIHRLRMLQLMTPGQLAGIREAGIDLQLHTHRHRTPKDKNLFSREIRDNQRWIESRLGLNATHFCYPSGVYASEFLPWLRAEGVESATTCEYGLAEPSSDPLLLPRVLDSMFMTGVDFEGWLAGLSAWMPHRRIRR